MKYGKLGVKVKKMKDGRFVVSENGKPLFIKMDKKEAEDIAGARRRVKKKRAKRQQTTPFGLDFKF